MPTCPECLQSNPELGAKCPRCEESYYVDDAAAESSERDPYIGKMAADKFVVVSRISEGGMGTVYQALQLPVDRKVAFKVLRADLEDNEDIRRRFIREARAVAKIAHPNIIHLHDFGFDESGYPYMVMEYAPGTNLDEWIHRDDITVERGLHVARQILSALADAHAAGIVHRDLKPENIIVRGTGTDEDFIKLLDFGIARMVNEQATSGLTREGEVFGTPHYMSPEQAEGETGVGPAADVYAVGIILYEMLCGEHPFDAPKPLSILFKQINEPLPRIEPRPGFKVPDWVADVVRKATQKDPAHRFENAGAMLEAFEDPRPTSTQPAPRGGVDQDQFDRPEDTGTSDPSAEADSEVPTETDSMSPSEETAPSAADVEVEDPNPTVNPSLDEGTAAATSGLGWGRRHLVATVIGAAVVLLFGGGALLMLVPESGRDPQAAVSRDAGSDSTSSESTSAESTAATGASAPETKEPDVGTIAKQALDPDASDEGPASPARPSSEETRQPAAPESAGKADLVPEEEVDKGASGGTAAPTGSAAPEQSGARAPEQQETPTETEPAEPAETASEAEDSNPTETPEPKTFEAPEPSNQTSPSDESEDDSDDTIKKFGDPTSVDDSSQDSEESNDSDDGVQKFGPPGE
jgi:serine/threonine protein kinase